MILITTAGHRHRRAHIGYSQTARSRVFRLVKFGKEGRRRLAQGDETASVCDGSFHYGIQHWYKQWGLSWTDHLSCSFSPDSSKKRRHRGSQRRRQRGNSRQKVLLMICPFCRRPDIQSHPGKTACPSCQTVMEIDDRGECVLVDTEILRVLMG